MVICSTRVWPRRVTIFVQSCNINVGHSHSGHTLVNGRMSSELLAIDVGDSRYKPFNFYAWIEVDPSEGHLQKRSLVRAGEIENVLEARVYHGMEYLT